MTAYVAPLSYAAAALAYLFAAGLLIVSRAQHRYKALLLTACLVTSVWALAAVAGTMVQMPALGVIVVALEQARSVAWIAAIAFVLFIAYRKRVDHAAVMIMGSALALAVTYILGLAVYSTLGGEVAGIAVRMTFIARIVIAVVGLLLVENLFRNCGAEARWAVKYLCFGAGVIFAYDFFIYAEAALFDRIETRIYAARGMVNAMAAPLIILAAVRSKSWPIDVHVSRQLIFRSASLLVAGSYLIVMSMVGYSLRMFDGAWGTVMQMTFLTAAALFLAIVLSSGKVQAQVKDFISRNFFSYKYDYRKEWLQFIASISASPNGLKIPDRVVRALANIVESTGAALWLRGEDEAYHVAAAFNMGGILPAIAVDHPFIAGLTARQSVVDIKRREIDGIPEQIAVPEWLDAHSRAWLAIPLMHGDELFGVVVLGQPRAPRVLGWEDFELLRTVGCQAASYLAEAESAQSLAQARRFEEFNRQFAFVIHDIKNLAGQMNLIVKNAERYGDNPEFQKDMLRTVGHCATRMRTLLEQIKSRTAAAAPPRRTRFDIAARLNRLADVWRLQIPNLHTDLPSEPIQIETEAEQLDTVLNHLLQNALEAVGGAGQIALEFHIEGTSRTNDGKAEQESWAIVTVSDNGPGMDRTFIDTKLFQPLTSVKPSGFGIGAYQARQLIRDMGGRLEVDSQPGRGTRMIMHLPLGASVGAALPEDNAPELRARYG